MSTVTVSQVSSRKDNRAFLRYPYDAYRDEPFWVPPLRIDTKHVLSRKKNPFFDHGDMQLFIARDEKGNVVGRIAAIVNGEHLRKYDDGVGFFGFFEAADDLAVSEALLRAAANWLRARGLTHMRGPVNPSMNDTAGLLVDGFDSQPAILMPYNHPWYEAHLLTFGLERAMTMWAYYTNIKYLQDAKLKRGSELVLKRYPGLRVRNLDMDHFKRDAEYIREIYNEAWSDNWGHVPMTNREFDRLAKDLKQIIDPRLVVLVEDDGDPVAFAVSLPDLNYAIKTLNEGRLLPFGFLKLLFLAKSDVIREIRMPLMGVRRSHHGRGLDALVINQTIQTGRRMGITGCEMSWVLDSNSRLKSALHSLNSAVDKEYGLYEMRLP